MNSQFKFPPLFKEDAEECYLLSKREAYAFLRPDKPLPSNWVEENISLSRAYVNPGPIKLMEWQRFIVDLLPRWNTIYLLGPVQTGKSLLAELFMYYGMSVYGLSGMMAYSNEKIVKKVFKTRISDMIRTNECLKMLWSGKEDEITIESIQLLNCLWGIASARNKNDIASFPAGMIIGSEVSKWEVREFDPVSMLKGRQGAYLMRGLWKRVFESSPYNVEDCFYREIFRPGVLILRPYVPCANCGYYQHLTDEQIRVLPDDNGKITHDPAIIRARKADGCVYECIKCKYQMNEDERVKQLKKVIWVAPEIEERVNDNFTFRQNEETVIRGEIIDRDESKYDAICCNWNRLIDPGFTFYECMARFFESKNDPSKFRVYLNEDMARFYRGRENRVASGYLEKKRILSKYSQHDDTIPDGVLVITFGGDSQDAVFYYVVQGWGAYLETWILRHGVIKCDMNAPEFVSNPEAVYLEWRNRFYEEPLLLKNGQIAEIHRGFQDRGGHRAADVDEIVMNTEWLSGYIGSPRDDPKKNIIWETDKEFYYGKTEIISDFVGAQMIQKKWHLPNDADDDFLRQIVKQYHYKEIDSKGNEVMRFKSGGEDHYRDCLNLSYAALVDLNMHTGLLNPDVISNLSGVKKDKEPEPVKTKENTQTVIKNGRRTTVRRGGSYFMGGRV